jgi:MazG family protein
MENSKTSHFIRLLDVIHKLRDPESGCPWDLKQTHKSLTKYLLEESHEFVDAVMRENYRDMEEEIGDVLLQVILHCEIASEAEVKNENFNIESVSKILSDKMIKRHPHVFLDSEKKITASEVTENWEEIKQEERKMLKKYYINGKDNIYSALTSSEKIGKKTSTVNFDWNNYHEVIDKVEEEWQEVKDELPRNKPHDKTKIKEEIGDLLFSIAQLARHLDINPEIALKEANFKFTKRFNQIEDLVKSSERQIKDVPRSELEDYWKEVKKR